ncbi:hypothetical protein TNCV_3236691 [Trichonephila clavipes]|nr:hypothetical protein TNCV_3236691 [Trichonephila clavipes]
MLTDFHFVGFGDTIWRFIGIHPLSLCALESQHRHPCSETIAVILGPFTVSCGFSDSIGIDNKLFDTSECWLR